jgi:ParB/RepB/Spo0J family partition protein
MPAVQNISVSSTVPGDNDRKNFDAIALQELADSIAEHGLAQPITVRPVNDGKTFQIVAGERRFRAISQVLGWDTIPALVKELDDEAASAVMLMENTSREDLNPIEEARAYQKRIDRFDWSASRIAKIAGVSAGLVKRRLKLLDLVDELQKLVANDHFPIGHAELLSELDANRQRIAMRVYSESDGMPYRTFKGVVSQLLEEQSQDGLFDLEAFWVEQAQQQAEIPTRGKHAIVDVPKRRDLPEVQFVGGTGASGVIKQYIADLESQGLDDEAATVGTLYDALVRMNFMSVR